MSKWTNRKWHKIKVEKDTLWQTYHQSQVPWMIKWSFRGRLEMMKVNQISTSLDELKSPNAFQIDQKKNKKEIKMR